MDYFKTKKLVLTAILAVLAVAGSTFSIPVMGSKCAPIQHLINVISAVLLGPFGAVAQAFTASLIRNFLGIGTVLAFPGSMFGALLAGVFYKYFGKLYMAYIGELFGTAVIGALFAYPVAAFIMMNSKVAMFTFVMPFFISTAGGTVISVLIMTSIQKKGILDRVKSELNPS